MNNYNVTLLREFTVNVEADDLENAQAMARRIAAQFPDASCKLLSIEKAGVISPPAIRKPRRQNHPRRG